MLLGYSSNENPNRNDRQSIQDYNTTDSMNHPNCKANIFLKYQCL